MAAQIEQQPGNGRLDDARGLVTTAQRLNDNFPRHPVHEADKHHAEQQPPPHGVHQLIDAVGEVMRGAVRAHGHRCCQIPDIADGHDNQADPEHPVDTPDAGPCSGIFR